MVNKDLSQDGLMVHDPQIDQCDIYYMNKLKNKNYMIIFIGTQRLLIKFNVHL